MANNKIQQPQYFDQKVPLPIKGMYSNYSHYVAPDGTFSYLENFDVDELGYLISRPPIYNLKNTGDVAPAQIQGVCCYLGLSAGGQPAYGIAQTSSFSTGSPTVTSGLTPIASSGTFSSFSKNIFCKLGNYIFYTDNTNAKYYDYSTGTAGVAGFNFPGAIRLINAGFGGRFWGISYGTKLSSGNDQNLYYTNVINGTTPNLTTGGTAFITLNTKGSPIIAAIEKDDTLFVFTAQDIFRVKSPSQTDNTPFASVGIVDSSAAILAGDSIFFCSSDGIYRIRGGAPELISDPIENFFQDKAFTGMDFADTRYVAVCSWKDNQAVYFSLGYRRWIDVSSTNLNSTSNKGVVLKYNYIKSQWSTYSFQDFYPMAADTLYPVNGDAVFKLFNLYPYTVISGRRLSDNTGLWVNFNVLSYWDGEKPAGSATTNANNSLGDLSRMFPQETSTVGVVPINCIAETQWLVYGNENHIKEISGISVASENASGFNLSYQIDNMNDSRTTGTSGQWIPIGPLTDNYMTFFRNFISKGFYRIKFRITGATTGSKSKIGQITILQVTDKGYGVN